MLLPVVDCIFYPSQTVVLPVTNSTFALARVGVYCHQVIHEFDSVSLIYECLPRDLRAVLDERCSDEYVRGPATSDQQLKHYFM